jgi:hypothetical protein
MSIRLSIEIMSPLETTIATSSRYRGDDLAIANHEMRRTFSETFGDDDSLRYKRTPAPCAFLNPRDAARICIGEAGHRGRHRFRTLAAGDVDAAGARAN